MVISISNQNVGYQIPVWKCKLAALQSGGLLVGHAGN